MILLLVGKSGSGKSTLADELERTYGLKQVQSYTTRPPRYPNEKGHTFVTTDEFFALKNFVAYTVFNDHFYAATADQFDGSVSYIVDPFGVKYFMEHYTGDQPTLIVYIYASAWTRFRRMLKRGDGLLKTLSRLWHDFKAFRNLHYDYKLHNKSLELSLDVLHRTGFLKSLAVAKKGI